MKRSKKCLFGLSTLTFVFLLSCARVPQHHNSENLPTLTAELASEKGKTSVVRITGGNLMRIGTGSGFFVQPDKIVTNLHVIARPGPIFAKLGGEDAIWMVEGVTAYDMENDLVVLKIIGEGIPLSLGNSETVQKGETVYAIGYPGGGEYKLAEGTVQDGRYQNKWLQTTADISKGNSGGPMLNDNGEVIGVSTAVDDSHSYAVPADTLKTLLSESTAVKPLAAWYKQKRIRAYSYHERGEDKYSDKQYKAAIDDLSKSIELDAEYTQAYAARGYMASHYGEAIVRYGRIADARQHYLAAIKDYTETIKLDADSDENYNGRAHTYSHYGEYEANQRNTTEAEKHYLAAIEDYTKAIKLDSDDSRNYSGRAWAKSLLGELNVQQEELGKARKLYLAAIKDYTKAIKLDPEDDINYKDRGWVKYLVGELRTKQRKTDDAEKFYRAAIADTEKAIQLDADRATTYHTRGVARAALGEYDSATADFDTAIEHDSDYAEAYRSRGKTKQALGEEEAAKT